MLIRGFLLAGPARASTCCIALFFVLFVREFCFQDISFHKSGMCVSSIVVCACACVDVCACVGVFGVFGSVQMCRCL